MSTSSKVAFVTGSNKGIGYAIVEKLARHYNASQDWSIYLTARNPALGLKAVESLKDKGLSVNFHQLDINDSISRKSFLNFLHSNYGKIDIVVNNAGIAVKSDSHMSDLEQSLLVFQTNFTSTVQFTEEFIPLLADNARVVNLCSLLGRSAFTKLSAPLIRKFMAPMTLDELKSLMSEYVRHLEKGDQIKHGWTDSAYSVSKLGLIKASYILGDILKKDWRNIILNSCCPGYVDTDLTDHKGKKTIEEGADTPFYLATLPIGIKEPINQFVSARKVIDVLKPPASLKMY